MKVTVITVYHKHGTDVFIGEDMAAAMSGLEQYCREWIAEFTDPSEGYVDESGQWIATDKDVVDTYFRLAGEMEYYETEVQDVIPKKESPAE